MNTTADKKNFFYITILILTLVAVIVGAAFAIYNFLHSQEEGSSTVYTGTLSIEYLSGNIINLHDIFPINDPKFETEENVYKNKFQVSNTGTLDGILTVNMEITKNQFSEGSLKYKLFNSEGELLTTGIVPRSGNVEIANSILLESEKSVEFTLIIWLEETGENQNQEMRKELVGLIKADANQKRD